MNKKIKDAFDKLKDGNENTNKVVYINADKYNFTLKLSPDEFISSEGNTIIKFEEGNLNLALDNKPNITVQLKESTADLMMKGNGILDIGTVSGSSSINITNNFDINGSFTLNVLGSNCERISIDSISLSNDASFLISKSYGNINSYIGKVNVAPYSRPSLSSIDINDELNIEQTALLTINDNVDMSNAKMNMNFNNYDDSTALLTGVLDSAPSSIKLKKASGNNKGPIKNKEYEIVNGIFSYQHCSSWLDVLDLGDSGFNEKYCQNVYPYGLSLNSFNTHSIEVLIVKAKSKSGLSTGGIIGIVFAVIVVVIIVMRRKKNGSSNEDDANHNEDL